MQTLVKIHPTKMKHQSIYILKKITSQSTDACMSVHQTFVYPSHNLPCLSECGPLHIWSNVAVFVANSQYDLLRKLAREWVLLAEQLLRHSLYI